MDTNNTLAVDALGVPYPPTSTNPTPPQPSDFEVDALGVIRKKDPRATAGLFYFIIPDEVSSKETTVFHE